MQPPDVFCKNGVLKNFATFTGKHLFQSLFLNKVPGLRPATLLKKRLWYRCFPVNFATFLRIPLYTSLLDDLLLSSVISINHLSSGIISCKLKFTDVSKKEMVTYRLEV